MNPRKNSLELATGRDRRVPRPVLGQRKVLSLCPECGPNVRVDEDGLCAACGCTATGSWLEQASLSLVGVIGQADERKRCVGLIRKYLSYNSQRAVSWHEVNDCIAAIEAEP